MTEVQLAKALELYDALGLPELVDPADEGGCLELIAEHLAKAAARPSPDEPKREGTPVVFLTKLLAEKQREIDRLRADEPKGDVLRKALPFLPADLEDDTSPPDWHSRVLRALAAQLGVGNDFYYPLLGAAQELEPSPSQDEGELRRASAADDRIDELEEAFHRIAQWADAYPLDIFPEPDLKKAAELLKAGGITIDSVSAHVARHVIEGVGKIAREVLSRSPEPQTQKGSRPAEAEREPS